MICRKCGKQIPDNARICMHCKNVIVRTPQNTPKQVTAPAKRPAPPAQRPPDARPKPNTPPAQRPPVQRPSMQNSTSGTHGARPAPSHRRPSGNKAPGHTSRKKHPATNPVTILVVVCAILTVIVGAIFISSLNDNDTGRKDKTHDTDANTVKDDDVVIITFSKDDDPVTVESTPDVTDTSDTETTVSDPADSSAESADTQTDAPVNVPGGAVVAPPVVSADPCTYYDDAAFIGDSVSLMLSRHAMNGSLGSATFLTRGSYSMCHAAWNTMYLTYQGQDMTPEDALAASGVNKVFIMLGMNDIGAYGIDKTMEHWEMVIGRIKEKCPDIEIHIQSCTPIYATGEVGELTNANMNEYNRRLAEFANENGYYFLDVAAYMKDSNGALAAEYCSDEFVHLTDLGAATWVKILKDYASDK